ncbi:hypothetical protein T09_7187 [Trichinella sp. T9]|nr:hypothetical protein T09_7187 [Trichinella sp. T9]
MSLLLSHFMTAYQQQWSPFCDKIVKYAIYLGKSNLTTTSDTDQLVGNNLREKREDENFSGWKIRIVTDFVEVVECGTNLRIVVVVHVAQFHVRQADWSEN